MAGKKDFDATKNLPEGEPTQVTPKGQKIGLPKRRDVMAGLVERRGRHDEDRAVDEQRRHQGHRRIDRGVSNCLSEALSRVGIPACLNDGRMEIQIVRHHGRSDDADRHHDHPFFAESRSEQGLAHFEKVGPCLGQHKDLDEKATGDRRDVF